MGRIATERIYREESIEGTDRKRRVLVAAVGQPIPNDYEPAKKPAPVPEKK